jgi:archaellum component FlaG (FlaF/FlaG flagellin family)
VRWTSIVGVFTGLLFAATGISAYFLHTTDEAIRIQGGTMQRQLEIATADQRPWIGAPEEIKIDQSGEFTTFTFILRNVGRNPTSGLNIDAHIVDGNKWKAEVLALCEKERSKAIEASNFHDFSAVPGSLFPTGFAASWDSTGVTKIETAKLLKDSLIAGCVTYQWHRDAPGVFHQTGFIAPVAVTDGRVSIPYIWAIQPN